jgi:hypothetical protein
MEDLVLIWSIILKMGLKEIGCEGVDRIHLAHGRVSWRVLVNM